MVRVTLFSSQAPKGSTVSFDLQTPSGGRGQRQAGRRDEFAEHLAVSVVDTLQTLGKLFPFIFPAALKAIIT